MLKLKDVVLNFKTGGTNVEAQGGGAEHRS